jgi:endo-1,4-beta-D-glucanase Y
MKTLWLALCLLATTVYANPDKEIKEYYEKWKQTYLVKEDNGLFRIATDKKDKHRTVSEGQGYGMLIFSMMAHKDKDAKKIFDGLWRYSRVHSSLISKDLMAWQIPKKKGENSSAFDGDADIAYALIVANSLWGNKGEIRYKDEALNLLKAIWKHTISQKTNLPLLGNWVHNSSKKYTEFSVRTSDFMTGHFKTFYRFSQDKKWLKVVKATQKAMIDVQNSTTGLIPDFIDYDKKSDRFVAVENGFLEQHDGDYYYNACRIPFRLGVDVLINQDATSKKIITKLSHWMQKNSQNDPLKIKSGYELNGKVIGDYFSIVFAAPFGVAALSVESKKQWAEKIYNSVKNTHENYYEDSITLLSMLAMKGYFIDPTKMVK